MKRKEEGRQGDQRGRGEEAKGKEREGRLV